MNRSLFTLCVLAIFAISCNTSKKATTSPTTVASLMDTSSVLAQSFTGLFLYDFEKKQSLFEQNVNRYFTPASNTKLYTFYACLKTLGDSIPALRYVVQGDSLIFWGTGDPSFLHPDFKNETRVMDFFKSFKDKKIFFSVGNFTNEIYGEGWAWDDYNDNYQTELTPFPMYGNVIRFNVMDKKLSFYPSFFKDSIKTSSNSGTFIKRDINNNQFNTPQYILQKTKYDQEIPYKTSFLLTQKMLSDTLKQAVGLLKTPVPLDALTLFSMPIEPIYRQMLQISDNMLAEQLLLLCSSTLKDSINSSFSISQIKEKHLKDLPDAPKWIDGSGLSRYNLFTPRATVKLLEKTYVELPQDKLFSLLSTSGQGTLSSSFPTNQPFIFAKSGSMSGVYNLSGYLKTQKGKLLIFSFMNNNFNKPTSSVRKEVEKILTWVHLNY